MYSTITTHLSDGILQITINRPDQLNALNKHVFDDLDSVMQEVYLNDDIKSAFIIGAGSKSFVAGADIKEFSSYNKEEAIDLSKRGQAVFFKIENCPKPIIAAVNGFALGGGCELAMACHLRICSEQAKFGQPEVNLGLIPGYGGTQRLTQLIGKAKSLELQMTAQIIDATEAERLGLVNHITTTDNLIPKTIELLQTILSKAPVAIGKIIECVNTAVLSDSAYTNGKSGYEKESEAFGDCFTTEDMKEGTTAFIEKRKPTFKGK